ncbi:MAG: DUF6788 family protein [Bryobacteraceae bacterium]
MNNTLGKEATFMMMPKSLESLAQRRVQITDRIAALSDLRCGPVTSTTGRCGKPNCHCHQPKDPGHGPNLRLTYKVNGKSVTESLPDQAAIRKAEREIAEFRKLGIAVWSPVSLLIAPRSGSLFAERRPASRQVRSIATPGFCSATFRESGPLSGTPGASRSKLGVACLCTPLPLRPHQAG